MEQTAVSKVDRNLPGMTKKQAMYLLQTVWPEAPEVEIIKAAMICHQYGLNPLMKQIALVRFKKWDEGHKGVIGESWEIIIGIKANRLIAQQKGLRYSYIDGPRVMTEQEQVDIFGEVELDKVKAITRVKDRDGNEYPGYGFWPKNKNVHGADKGNSPLNMAFIRSERNALDKMAPGALPEVDAIDDAYMEVDNVPLAIEQGKHEFQEAVEVESKALWEQEESIPPHIPQNQADLLAWVCEAKSFLNIKTARYWLENEMQYTTERIAKDPTGIYEELKERM